MFLRLKRGNLLTVVCIFNIVVLGQQQGIPPGLFTPPTIDEGCQNLLPLVRQLKMMPVVQAFNIVTAPLMGLNVPPEIKLLRENLFAAVQRGLLKIDNVLFDLDNVPIYNRNDLMITVFMAIIEYGQVDCRLKQDLNKLLFYVLKRRYLQKEDFDLTVPSSSCSSSSLSSSPSPASPPSPSSCVPVLIMPELRLKVIIPGRAPEMITLPILEELIKKVSPPPAPPAAVEPITKPVIEPYPQPPSVPVPIIPPTPFLLSNIQQGPIIPPNLRPFAGIEGIPPSIERTPVLIPRPRPFLLFGQKFNWPQQLRQFPLFRSLAKLPPKLIPYPPRLSPVTPVADVVPTKQRVLPDDLMKVVPPPKTEYEKKMYDKLGTLLRSPEVGLILNKIDPTKFKNIQEIFDFVLTTITQQIHTDEVEEIVRFFINYNYIKQAGFNYGSLIPAIPLPKNEKEAAYYKNMKEFLTSKDIYILLEGIGFDHSLSLEEQLIEVLVYLLRNNKVPPQYLEAAKYYLPLLLKNRSSVKFDELVPLLPKPITPEDRVHYNNIKALLEGNEIYIIMNSMMPKLSAITDKQELLNRVLQKIIMEKMLTDLSNSAKYYRNLMAVRRFGFNYFDLMNTVNLVGHEVEYRIVIKDYMYSADFEKILLNKDISKLDDRSKLVSMLTDIKQTATDRAVANAAARVLDAVEKESFYREIQGIIELLPQPRNADEQQKYAIAKGFLTSDKGFYVLRDIDRSAFPDRRLLAEFMFKKILQSNLGAPIVDTFKYYYELMAQLDPVEVIMTKEIKKNIKVNEIFSDTLQPLNLDLPHQVAFKKVYLYVKNNPRVVTSFDSWDHAATKAQFLQMLFNYLLSQPSVPNDIKQSITFLQPMIHVTGKAALPP